MIFDWDGTLADSISVIAESIVAACVSAGYDAPPIEKARHIIGLGIKESFEYICPGIDFEKLQKAALKYRDEFIAREKNILLFEEIKDGLIDLKKKGFVLAVATGKSRRGLERAFDGTGTRGLFSISRTADEAAAKPDPKMLFEIMHEMDASASECIMIGDTLFDLQMAKNANMDAIAVGYGAHSKDILQKEKPLFVAETVRGLFEYLK